MSVKKNKVGRPKGRLFPHKPQVGFTVLQWAILAELQERDKLDSPAAVLRRLVTLEGQQRGILAELCSHCGGKLIEGHCAACEAIP